MNLSGFFYPTFKIKTPSPSIGNRDKQKYLHQVLPSIKLFINYFQNKNYPIYFNFFISKKSHNKITN